MIKPLNNRIIVERTNPEEVTSSGLIIPDTAKEKPQQGKIVAVGPGARNKDGERMAMDVKEGDTVLFAKYGGTDVTIEGKEYLVLREDDIMAVVG